VDEQLQRALEEVGVWVRCRECDKPISIGLYSNVTRHRAATHVIFGVCPEGHQVEERLMMGTSGCHLTQTLNHIKKANEALRLSESG
jgi:hypothetical protein